MKRSKRFGFLFALFFALLLAGSAGATVPTYIDACGYVISSPGVYVVTQDLFQVGAGNCITIDADNVLLDCQDFWMNGDDSDFSYGIYLSGQDLAEIYTCNIRDFNGGVILDNATTIWMSNIVTTSNTGHGIYIGGASSDNVQITGLESFDNEDTGLNFQSSNFTLSNSNLYENIRWDVELNGSCDAVFNNVTGSGGRPIDFYNSAVNFTVADGPWSELILCNADNSTVDGVTIMGSDTLKNNGLLVVLTDNASFTDITSSDNENGMRFWDSSGNIVLNSTLNNNVLGIYLGNSSNNTIRNTTADNGAGGIYFDNSPNNDTTGSSFCFNTLDVECASSDPQTIFATDLCDTVSGCGAWAACLACIPSPAPVSTWFKTVSFELDPNPAVLGVSDSINAKVMVTNLGSSVENAEVEITAKDLEGNPVSTGTVPLVLPVGAAEAEFDFTFSVAAWEVGNYAVTATVSSVGAPEPDSKKTEYLVVLNESSVPVPELSILILPLLLAVILFVLRKK